jgi:opacity protein-like surface antigen
MGVWKITNGERVLKRFLPLSLVVLALAAAPALAEVTKGNWYLEGGLGYYISVSVSETFDDPLLGSIESESEIRNDVLINVRGGRFFTKRWGLEVQLWRAFTEVTGAADGWPFPGADADVSGLDVSAVFCPNPTGKNNFLVVGGIGYVIVDFDLLPEVKEALKLLGMTPGDGDSSLTLHLGAAGRINVTDSIYVRTDVRYLYVNGIDFGFPSGDSQLNNFLITVNVGWVFGK